MDDNPTHSNCFMYAFDCLHERGGHITIGMSTRASPTDGSEPWNWQHLGWYDGQRHRYMSYVPPGDLPQHWHSWFEFTGAVVDGDAGYRKPMSVSLMYRGVFALLIALTIWYATRQWEKLWRRK